MNGLPIRAGARFPAFLGVFLVYPLARVLALGLGPLLAVSVAQGHSGA
jgi:hypothetical protein